LGIQTAAGRIATYAIGLVTSVLIARALGPAGRGAYYLPVTIVLVTSVVVNVGTVQAQLRLWSRRTASGNDFVTAGFVLTAISSVIAFAGIFLLVSNFDLASSDELRPKYLAIALLALPASIHLARSGSLLALNRDLRGVNHARLAGAIVQTTGTAVLFALDRLTVNSVLVMYVLSVATPALLVAVWTRKIGHVRLPIPWSFIRDYLKLGLQLGPAGILLFLSLRLDVFFIARYQASKEVGLYSVAVTVAELVWLVTEALRISVSERLANAPKKEALDVTYRAVRMTVIVAAGIASGIAITAPILIPTLFGDAFAPSVTAVWILLPATLFMAVWQSQINTLVRFSRPWTTSAIAAIALVVNGVGNLLMIPLIGIRGAAFASLLGYSVGAILTCLALARVSNISLMRLLPGKDDVRQILELVKSRPSARIQPQTEVEVPPELGS
jgi:O-antigen/teichoic acid export membrane protein